MQGGFKQLHQNLFVSVGAIPDSFGTAPNLATFDVKGNSLTKLPSAWTNASYNAVNSSLVNIRASFNNISVNIYALGLLTVLEAADYVVTRMADEQFIYRAGSPPA